MSNFTEPLILSPGQDKLWVTDATLTYEIGMRGSGLVVVIPKGFQTDLGTIPWYARTILNPADARCSNAFVLHDFLCDFDGFTKVVADAILFEALSVLGVEWWKRAVIYAAVRAWHSYTKLFGEML